MNAPMYKNLQNNNTDTATSHPMGAASQNPATMGKDCGCEYRETAASGIEKTGVGSWPSNDAARERQVKHPTAEDLSQAGSLGNAKSMR